MKARLGLRSVWTLGVCLALGGLVGCSGQSVQAGTSGGQNLGGGTQANLGTLARQLEQAPWVIPYHGIRRLELNQKDPAISYREEVSADGQGGFQLNVLELLSVHPDPVSALRQLEQTKGFQYRYRGFRVQDAGLFQLAYQISLLSKSEEVAGITCTRMHVDHQNVDPNLLAVDAPNHYLVDFDPNTGLILRWQEIDPLGDLVAKMEFESLTYGDPGVPMHPLAFAETEISLRSSLDDAVGFHVLRPGLLPQNFRLHRITRVQDGDQTWVRMVFTDGVETLLLMHRPKVELDQPEASTIGAYASGDRTVVMGAVNGYELIAEGRLNVAGMQDFVSSCFQ